MLCWKFKSITFFFLLSISFTEDAVFAEPGPGGGSMMAGAVYTLPPQRNVPLPMAMQRLIPMATQGGKPRSFTLPRDSNLHTLLVPPAKEEQQTHNGEFSRCIHVLWLPIHYTRTERLKISLIKKHTHNKGGKQNDDKLENNKQIIKYPVLFNFVSKSACHSNTSWQAKCLKCYSELLCGFRLFCSSVSLCNISLKRKSFNLC